MTFLSCAPILIVILYRLLMGEEANTLQFLDKKALRDYRIELETIRAMAYKTNGLRRVIYIPVINWIDRELGNLRIAENTSLACFGRLKG